MTRTIAGATAMIVAVVTGYAVGWRHGSDTAELQADRAVEVRIEPYPYADVCGDMLEAAWSVGDRAVPLPPHD